MSREQPLLNDEEVWDDSALIDSWNDALKEYKVMPSDFRNLAGYLTDLYRNTTAFMRKVVMSESWMLRAGKFMMRGTSRSVLRQVLQV